jgi:hypothetical protein
MLNSPIVNKTWTRIKKFGISAFEFSKELISTLGEHICNVKDFITNKAITNWPLVVVGFTVGSIYIYQRYLHRFDISDFSSPTDAIRFMTNSGHIPTILFVFLMYAVQASANLEDIQRNAKYAKFMTIPSAVFWVILPIHFLFSLYDSKADAIIKGAVPRYTITFDDKTPSISCAAIINANSELMHLWLYPPTNEIKSIGAVSYSREKIVSIKQTISSPPAPEFAGYWFIDRKKVVSPKQEEWAANVKSTCMEDYHWSYE